MTLPSFRQPGHRRQADRYLLAQAFLALFALLLASGLALVWRSALVGHLVALCGRAVDVLPAHNWALLLLLPPLLGALSFVLALLSLWRQGRATRRLLGTLRPTRPLPPDLAALAERLGLTGRLRLVVDPRPLVFCAGLVRPVVWLTTGLLTALDQGALEAILRHESHHVRHGDPLKLLLMRALADAFFFLPLVRELGRLYDVHKELAADAEAAQAPAGQTQLARALAQLLKEAPVVLDRAAVGPLMLGRQNRTTEARISQLANGSAPSPRPRRRNLMLTGAGLLLFLAVGLWPLVGTSHAERAGSCGPAQAQPVVRSLEVP